MSTESDVRAAIDEVRAWAIAQFGWTRIELELEVGTHTVVLRGTVAAPQLLERIRHACDSTIMIDASAVRGLASGRFVEVGNGGAALFRRPDRDPPGELATQLDAADGPVEWLADEGEARLVRACDGTVGWTRDALGEHVARPVFAAPTDLDGAVISSGFTRWIGAPYRLGGTRIAGIDCSGLVQRLLGAAKLRMPRHSTDQLAIDPQPGSAREVGTVVAIWSADEAPCHVGLALGDGRVVHASRSRAAVIVEDEAAFVGRAHRVAHVAVDALLRLQVRAREHADLLAVIR